MAHRKRWANKAMHGIEYFLKIYRRESYGIPKLEQIRAEYVTGSPEHLAATQLIAEIKEAEGQMDRKREDAKHTEAMTVARGANHIAKWAIVVALLALFIAVVQAFWH